MKKRICFFILCWTLLPLSMYAQKEMNWWYFGLNSGLNFNEMQTVMSSTGIPTVLPKSVKGPIRTNEGVFSLSDNNGNLLMSSNGVAIYNKHNQIMTNGNGLMGGNSSTQSAIVIPAPNDPNKFYVVTVAQEQKVTGIRYSIVNIDVNNPYDTGSVEVATKNSILKGDASYENILAVRHANGSDYWLIHRTNNVYYVWSLTNQGFSVGPQMYVTPPLKSFGKAIYIGESIISVDNTKIVGFSSGGREIISSNFDTNTGVISDSKVFVMTVGSHLNVYGGSFSPSGEYLYFSATADAGTVCVSYKIKYSDLRAGNVAPTNLGLGLQIANIRMASDQKLYGIKWYSKNLYVIMNPDEGGTDIRYFPNYLLENGVHGLPTFTGSFLTATTQAKPFSCAGYEAKLSVRVYASGANVPTTLVWNFGDGSAAQVQSVTWGVTEYKMNHVYANSGVYEVVVTPYNTTTAFTSILVKANIIDCSIKSNRMIRQELLNINELEINK